MQQRQRAFEIIFQQWLRAQHRRHLSAWAAPTKVQRKGFSFCFSGERYYATVADDLRLEKSCDWKEEWGVREGTPSCSLVKPRALSLWLHYGSCQRTLLEGTERLWKTDLKKKYIRKMAMCYHLLRLKWWKKTTIMERPQQYKRRSFSSMVIFQWSILFLPRSLATILFFFGG